MSARGVPRLLPSNGAVKTGSFDRLRNAPRALGSLPIRPGSDPASTRQANRQVSIGAVQIKWSELRTVEPRCRQTLDDAVPFLSAYHTWVTVLVATSIVIIPILISASVIVLFF